MANLPKVLRRQSRMFWLLTGLLLIDLALWIMVVRTPASEDCAAIGPSYVGSRCGSMPHVAGPLDVALASSAIVLIALIGLSFIRHRSSEQVASDCNVPTPA